MERLCGLHEVAAIGGLSGGRARAFRGAFAGESFTLRRVLSSGRPSFVSVKGTLRPEGGGTRIRLRLGLAGWRTALAAAALALYGAHALQAVWEGMGAGAMSGERVATVIVFPLALALALLGVSAERARVTRLLGYLTGELTSRGLAHELAEARE